MFTCSSVKEQHPTLAGTYSYGPGAEKGRTGSLTIFPQNDSTVLFYVNLNIGPPSYNSGELFDTLKVQQNKAIYNRTSGDVDSDCRWEIDFLGDSIRIRTLNNAYSCGFGGNVRADGIYKVQNHEIPKFVIKNQGDTLYFEGGKR